jgi:hypothetical protein
MIFAISIGINNDNWKEPDGIDTVEVTRSTLTNYEVSDSLEFLFKTAILTCDNPKLEISNNDRMKLAFDPNYKIKDFNPLKFLMGYITTGLEVIENQVYSTVVDDVISNLSYLTKMLIEKDKLTDEIIQNIIEKEIKNY